MFTDKVLTVLAVVAQIFIFSTDTDASCALPQELQNKDWEYTYTEVSTGNQMTKTLSFGTSTIPKPGISLNAEGTYLDTWTCISDLSITDTESVVVLKSDSSYKQFLNPNDQWLYLCMRFTKVTDDLFYFYLMSDIDTFVVPKERVFNPVSQPNENGDVCSTFCSYTDPKPMIRTLRKQGTTDLLPNDAALCEPCGDSCKQDVDNCDPNPCLHGGLCSLSDVNPSYTCSCAAGYEGPNCETNIDDCTPNPCLNGGQCSDDIASYTCSCAAGFKGNNCDQNIDDCTPNPCLNGGQCSDDIASYTCSCAAGFKGNNCDQIVCTVPGMVQFATGPTDKSFNNMETITYSCITGYEVQSGNLERSCQADGTWSGHPPVCKMTVDYFCATLLEMLENKTSSKKGWNENSEGSFEKETRGKSKGKYWNRIKGRRCGYYKELEALIIETCLLS
ncbi:unnamed protein product [Mytilus coruscus]|uniref:CSMD n=1 Tax=Mytilus coruscus TaxID=42192 RepID=A0A6J8DMZ7_MYTCO|nr:unnamed protein product [Mytilus coruscus]